MPVHQTGFSGQAVVPCSHCNANDKGPEAGICHRNRFGGGVACSACMAAAKGVESIGVWDAFVIGATRERFQIPCSHCDGKGYRRV
jgi:hypothetical protein